MDMWKWGALAESDEVRRLVKIELPGPACVARFFDGRGPRRSSGVTANLTYCPTRRLRSADRAEKGREPSC